MDPNRIAAEWSSGKGSAMYAYAVTDTIPTEEFKDQLVQEIESTMAGADDRGLDELELLLMHVEEQHPDRFPGSEMHETDEYLHDSGDWRAQANAELAKQGLRLGSLGKGEPGWYVTVVVDGEPLKVWATDEPEDDLDEGDGLCSECGGMKSEGVCECTMSESDREPSTYDYDDREMSIDQKRSAAAEKSRRDARKSPYDNPSWRSTEDLDEVELGWLRAAADKVKDVALTDIGGPEGFLSPADKATAHGKPRGKDAESDEFRSWKSKRAKNESPLRGLVLAILDEMKLSVAGRGHFDFGGGEEVSPDDVATFLLSKKPEPAPSAPASGVRPKKAKAKPKLKRKSKKTA